MENSVGTINKIEVFLDSNNSYYTRENLTQGIINHFRIKMDYSSIGLPNNYNFSQNSNNVENNKKSFQEISKEEVTKVDIPEATPPMGGNTSDVQLTVVRGERFIHNNMVAAYGKLYVNGEYWFDTGERKLLTPGTYKVAFRKETGCTITGRSDWLSRGKAGNPNYKFAIYSNGYVPLVLNTPGRAGIRIHQGTNVSWSEGCLVTGNYKNNRLENSWECWKRLYDYCYNANSVTITYQG